MKNMKQFYLFLVSFLLLTSMAFAQPFVRVGQVPLPAPENAGFGNILVGLDLDGDGKKEIYAVNNNWNDSGQELIPTIYKFEFNGVDAWEQVWKATLPIPLQNTWPALTWGDLDNDGRPEIIWGPVNFNNAGTNPNPWRIVVFEQNPGSENLGVPDPNSAGNFLPNAKWSIVSTDMTEFRPFKWLLHDLNGNGNKQIILGARNSVAPMGNIAVISVNNIPNNGDGSETWSLDFTGGPSGTAAASIYYDLAVYNANTILFIRADGAVVPFRYANGNYRVHDPIPGLVPNGSWKSAMTVDIDNNGTNEIVVASGVGSSTVSNRNVYVLQVSNDTVVTATSIADLTPLVGTTGILMGGAWGDLNGDGRPDFVFGSRGATPNAAISMVSYNGGNILSPSSYTSKLIDQDFASAGRWMHVAVGEVDGDPAREVVYGEGTGDVRPLVILDRTGQLPVELSAFSASVVSGKVKLSWTTESELNNFGFEIQRKIGEEEFRTIGFVAGKITTTTRQEYSYIDETVSTGVFSYRLKQVDLDGSYAVSQVIEVDLELPFSFNLEQNFPNPFNPVTTIQFGIDIDSEVSLKVYNMIGEEVATLINNEFKSAGRYAVAFNAENLPSGTYIYSLQSSNNVITKKMTLLK